MRLTNPTALATKSAGTAMGRAWSRDSFALSFGMGLGLDLGGGESRVAPTDDRVEYLGGRAPFQ